MIISLIPDPQYIYCLKPELWLTLITYSLQFGHYLKHCLFWVFITVTINTGQEMAQAQIGAVYLASVATNLCCAPNPLFHSLRSIIINNLIEPEKPDVVLQLAHSLKSTWSKGDMTIVMLTVNLDRFFCDMRNKLWVLFFFRTTLHPESSWKGSWTIWATCLSPNLR